MNIKNKGLSLLLMGAAVLSLVIPFKTLFMGEGSFTFHMTQQAVYRMLAEIGILFVLFALTCIFIRHSYGRLLAMAGIFVLFCWLHVTFLPMLASGLYVLYILRLGRFLRISICRADIQREGFGDFLLGAGTVIAEFCVMSLLGVGGIDNFCRVTYIQGALLLIIFFRNQKAERGRAKHKLDIFSGSLNRTEWLLLSFIIVMTLIQVGKMNITLDFDTLWYGVRSEYILDWGAGSGIYANPGLVGMAYVYSKGLEVLLFPLSHRISHSYLLFFNVWMTVFGLAAVYRISCFYMRKNYALLGTALLSAVPGLMNMSISAKTDNITWLLQLIMILYLLHYIKETSLGQRPVCYLVLAAGAYVLSLTMKPTALVFSTAIFGMAGLYLIFTRTLSFKAPWRHWLLLLPETLALFGIWLRTFWITGMPVMSVFTSIFAKLGFQIQYPFATGSLPQNWQDESHMQVLFRRLYQMLLAPEGKDMAHVVIAWGTSLLFFLLICLIVCILLRRPAQEGQGEGREERRPELSFAHVVFWPFLFVNLVSLVMLYQVDGNYFIMLYTAVILFACGCLSRVSHREIRRRIFVLLIPVLAFNVLLSAVSNWAWSLGFSQIQLINSGRVNHEELQRQEMIAGGNEEIWNTLAANSRNRVIAFGTHPRCLSFPCNVQSYKDITAPWGNVELVNSAEAFEEYMDYAKTDYVYAEAGYIGENSWSWSYGLLKELIARGTLVNLTFENGNMLARVNSDERGGNAFMRQGETAEGNEKLFMENYIVAD